MDCLPADIQAHLLCESINDPRGMAFHADKLLTISGRSLPVQALSDQFEDVFALPCHNSSFRAGACSSLPRSSSRS